MNCEDIIEILLSRKLNKEVVQDRAVHSKLRYFSIIKSIQKYHQKGNLSKSQSKEQKKLFLRDDQEL